MRTMVLLAAGLLLAGCGAGGGPAEPADPTGPARPAPDPAAALLPADAVPPAPPGDRVVEPLGSSVLDVVDQPTVQQEPCAMLEPSDVPGPPEPGAQAGAVGVFVSGVVQVDQRAVRYTDEAAAAAALQRARARTADCAAALRLHSTSDLIDAGVQAGAVPVGAEGVRITVWRVYPSGRSASEAAVLRSGRLVLAISAVETGAPAGEDWPLDGVVDPAWADDLMAAAAGQLQSAAGG